MLERVQKRAETSQRLRIDDNLETFEKRYQGYLDDTIPVTNHFRNQRGFVEVCMQCPLKK